MHNIIIIVVICYLSCQALFAQEVSSVLPVKQSQSAMNGIDGGGAIKQLAQEVSAVLPVKQSQSAINGIDGGGAIKQLAREVSDVLPVKQSQSAMNGIDGGGPIKQNANNNIPDDDEDLYPNIPLSLSDQVLHTKHTSSLKEQSGKVNVGASKPFFTENFPNEGDELYTQDIPKEENISPWVGSEHSFSYWRVMDDKQEINKKLVILPKAISRKKYGDDNYSLPPATYISDYKRLVFKEIKDNNLDGVDALLVKIQEFNFRDINGDTPLLYAAKMGRKQIFRSLIAQGADLSVKNLHDEDIYDIAIKNKKFEILKILNDIEDR